jgi:predicted GNAT family N-acyltransferase
MSVVVRTAESREERLAAWRIRERVFIDEQGIAEAIERDGLDDIAWHFVAWDGETAVGTARVIGLDGCNRPVSPAGAAAVKIGRMAVLPSKRRLGIGRRLLDAALELARQKALPRAELSAQEWVVGFYERAGFRVEGDPYVEAGIPHRRMSRAL